MRRIINMIAAGWYGLYWFLLALSGRDTIEHTEYDFLENGNRTNQTTNQR